METMYYIGLDVHKKTIDYCVKDGSGRIYAAGSIRATRLDLDMWMKTLPRPPLQQVRSAGKLDRRRYPSCEGGILLEHWDVIQDEATEEQSKSKAPMFGDSFPTYK